jgi:hypothetical protein
MENLWTKRSSDLDYYVLTVLHFDVFLKFENKKLLRYCSATPMHALCMVVGTKKLVVALNVVVQ